MTKLKDDKAFSHLCAARPKDHLVIFLAKLSKIWRSSSEKTVLFKILL